MLTDYNPIFDIFEKPKVKIPLVLCIKNKTLTNILCVPEERHVSRVELIFRKSKLLQSGLLPYIIFSCQIKNEVLPNYREIPANYKNTLVFSKVDTYLF